MNCFHLTLSCWMKVLNTPVLQNLLVGRQLSLIYQSTEHYVMSHCGKSINTLDIFYYYCYTTLILRYFDNCWLNSEWLKYHLSNLWCDAKITTVHPWPEQNSCYTHWLQRRPLKMNGTRGLPLATTFNCKMSPRQRCCLLRSLTGATSAACGSAASDEPT